jgi:hypothetical protein
MVFVKIILATLMVFVISQHSWCLWRSPVFVISQHSWYLWRSLTIIAPSPLGSSGRNGQLLCPFSCLTRCSCTCWCAWLVTLIGSLCLHLLMCLTRYSTWLVALALVDACSYAARLEPSVTCSCFVRLALVFVISQHSWCLWRSPVQLDLILTLPALMHAWCLWRYFSQHSWCFDLATLMVFMKISCPGQLDLILTIPAPSPQYWKYRKERTAPLKREI